MGNQIDVLEFSPKYVDEDDVFRFDFSRLLSTGELLSNPIITASVVYGIDLSPAGIISGVPSIQGSKMLQKIIDGIAGVKYCLKAEADTNSTPTRHLILVGTVLVRAAC